MPLRSGIEVVFGGTSPQGYPSIAAPATFYAVAFSALDEKIRLVSQNRFHDDSTRRTRRMIESSNRRKRGS